MAKALWVAAPLFALGLIALARALLGRPMSTRALNVHSSLLLLGYVAVTAGLGIFWVANQQLPVFDLHYLFGYATVVTLVIHLAFNLRLVVRHFRPRSAAQRAAAARPAPRARVTATRVGGWAVAGVALLGAFLLGARHGKTEVSVAWPTGPGARADSESGPLDVVERYHELSSHSRAGVLGRAPMVDWGTPEPQKRYDHAPRIALPKPAASATSRSVSEAIVGAPLGDSADVHLAALASVLFHGAGVTERRGGLSLRASPSSGALFASELYLVVREARDVEPGVYHYQPVDHALERIGDAADLEPLAGLAAVDAPATVVVTAVFRRTGHKYRDRAYRYVAADAGHLLENVRLAASEAGLRAWPLRAFDDARTVMALGIDGVEEGVIAVVPLASGSAARGAARADLPGRSIATSASFVYPEPPRDGGALGITGLVHRATSLRAAVPRAPPPSAPSAVVALPAPAVAEGGALATMGSRRSVRDFSRDPLRVEDLAALLRHATAPEPALSAAVRVHVVVARVAGVAPGAYRYDPDRHALVLARAGDLAAEAQSAALDQEVIGSAAVVLVLTLDRATLVAEGARGYRNGFLEAGMIGERVLLEAVARGLGGCPVGAFYDEEAAALLEVDSAREWVVHFAGIGPRAQ
jgi:SagB-type dehydrogenase family enzyme